MCTIKIYTTCNKCGAFTNISAISPVDLSAYNGQNQGSKTEKAREALSTLLVTTFKTLFNKMSVTLLDRYKEALNCNKEEQMAQILASVVEPLVDDNGYTIYFLVPCLCKIKNLLMSELTHGRYCPN